MNEGRIAVVARPEVSLGFAIAGVSVHHETDGRGASERLEALAQDGEMGVVMIEEALYRDMPDDYRRTRRHEGLPVVIPVPSPDWLESSKAHEYIVDILRRAIGYRVRLQ